MNPLRRRSLLLGGAVLPVLAVLILILTYRPSLPGDRIFLLFTQEIRGNVMACGCYEGQPGGLGRLPGAVGPDFHASSTLIVDGGDFVNVPTLTGFKRPEKLRYLKEKHASLIRVMDNLGYAAIALGDRDFSLGQAFLNELYFDKERKAPFVNANIHYVTPRGTVPLFKPYRIVKVGRGRFAGFPFGGIRVGILALISGGTRLPRLEEDVYTLTVADPGPTARAVLPRMKEDGAEILLLLFHGPWVEAERLARTVPGIDVVVVGQVGGDGTARPPGKVGETRLVQVMAGCMQVGKLILHLDGKRIRDAEFKPVLLAPEVSEDRRALAPYERFQESLKASPPRLSALKPVQEPYAGSKACKECHAGPWEQWRETEHARAFSALERRRHAGDPECLACHTTGFGEETGFGAGGVAEGLSAVGCEACHKPKGKHAEDWKRKKDAGQSLPEVKFRFDPFTLMCERCHEHNRDPGFRVNHKKRYAKIKH